MPLRQIKSYYIDAAKKAVDNAFKEAAGSGVGKRINSDYRPKLEKNLAQVLKVLDEVGTTYTAGELYDLVKYDEGEKKVALAYFITRHDMATGEEEPIKVADLLPRKEWSTMKDVKDQFNDSEFNAIRAIVGQIRQSKDPIIKEDKSCIQKIQRGEELTTEDVKVIHRWFRIAEDMSDFDLNNAIVIDELRDRKKAEVGKKPVANPFKSKYFDQTREYIKQLHEYEQRNIAVMELF